MGDYFVKIHARLESLKERHCDHLLPNKKVPAFLGGKEGVSHQQQWVWLDSHRGFVDEATCRSDTSESPISLPRRKGLLRFSL